LRLNDIVVDDESRLIRGEDINENGVIKLSFGKKKHVLIKESSY